MKLQLTTTLAHLILYIGSTLADISEGHGGVAFCYKEEDGCGPSTSAWPTLCHEGKEQSPIDLPASLKQKNVSALLMPLIGKYRANSFRLQNSGHSVSVDFVGERGENEGPTAQSLRFPIITPSGSYHYHEYKFASAHFHWGTSDSNPGSEHCIGSQCAGMEAHFVHYSDDYENLAEAIASGDRHALTVLGVLINPSSSNFSHPSLRPIVQHLELVKHASHDGHIVKINSPIDFTPLLVNGYPAQSYYYNGSLTTPGCNEQVLWHVLKRPVKVPHRDLEAFRSTLLDSNGNVLQANHRPIQPLNGRQVFLNNVIPTV